MKSRLPLLCALLVTAATAFAALPVVSNVTSTQRTGTKFVDITYDVADADGDSLKVRVEISDNNGATYSVPAFTFTGAIGDNVTPGAGKTIAWNAGTGTANTPRRCASKSSPSTRAACPASHGATRFLPAASSWVRTAASRAAASPAT